MLAVSLLPQDEADLVAIVAVSRARMTVLVAWERVAVVATDGEMEVGVVCLWVNGGEARESPMAQQDDLGAEDVGESRGAVIPIAVVMWTRFLTIRYPRYSNAKSTYCNQ
jgi:hypothetical protein